MKKKQDTSYKSQVKINPKSELTIALPKGRILKEAVALFKKIGIDCSDVMEDSRKLIFENNKSRIRFMVVRSQDVPTYVEYGAADAGIAGKDVLLEQERDIYEPLDLGIGICRMVVAEPKELGKKDNPGHWTPIRGAAEIYYFHPYPFVHEVPKCNVRILCGNPYVRPVPRIIFFAKFPGLCNNHPANADA